MQPIFSRNKIISRIAFLNWRIEKTSDILSFLNLAEGYIDSSLMLTKECLRDNKDKKADIIIFPILANVNHGIELYLKAILWMLNIILKSQFKVEGKHNLKQIFETVRSKIRIYAGGISVSEFDKHTTELKLYIEELFTKVNATPENDKMDFSRYPFDKKHVNHFYVDAISNVEVDIENFAKHFKKVKDGLEFISTYLYYQELGAKPNIN